MAVRRIKLLRAGLGSCRHMGATSHSSAAPHQVLHNGRITTVDSTELLPGDVVVLHPGVLPCDIALVRCSGGPQQRLR